MNQLVLLCKHEQLVDREQKNLMVHIEMARENCHIIGRIAKTLWLRVTTESKARSENEEMHWIDVKAEKNRNISPGVFFFQKFFQKYLKK